MKAKSLKRKSNSVNNKSFRKKVISSYKSIKSNLKYRAKKGYYDFSFVFNLYGNDGLVTLTAFRLFRLKHRDFTVKIKGIDFDNRKSDSFYESNKIKVRIKF